MNNPFVIDVTDILRGDVPERIAVEGSAPLNLGGEMLGIREGDEVTVEGTLSNLGEAIMVDATVRGTATGTCARCLKELHPALSMQVNEVFGIKPDFITGEDDEDETEKPALVEDNTVNITQAVVDDAGLNIPFSPVCENYGQACAEETPGPDGISGEEEPPADPRWAGLEKFLDEGEK